VGDYNINEWVVVSATTGRFFGRLACSDRADGRKMFLEDVKHGGTLHIEPCFEFAAVMRRNERGQTERLPLLSPVDFVVMGVPVYVRATSIYFCAEMKPEDQRTYSELVKEGLAIMTRARAGAAGLSLPSAAASQGSAPAALAGKIKV
jgi:hypothetical protein